MGERRGMASHSEGWRAMRYRLAKNEDTDERGEGVKGG